MSQQLGYTVKHFGRILARLDNIRSSFHVQTAQLPIDGLQLKAQHLSLLIDFCTEGYLHIKSANIVNSSREDFMKLKLNHMDWF